MADGFTLDNYPYRSGILYASARAAAAAVHRAIRSLDRGDHATAAETLRHALELIEPRLGEIDEVDRARLARLAASPAGESRAISCRSTCSDAPRAAIRTATRRGI
jgi:hypothetical protein